MFLLSIDQHSEPTDHDSFLCIPGFDIMNYPQKTLSRGQASSYTDDKKSTHKQNNIEIEP